MEELLARTYRLLSTDPDIVSRVGNRIFVDTYPVEDSDPNFRPLFPYIVISEVVFVGIKTVKNDTRQGNSVQDIDVFTEDYQEKIDIRNSIVGLLSQFGVNREIDPSREAELRAFRDRMEWSFWSPR